MTHKVIISLASNHDQEKNLHQARLCLAQILSSCFYTDAIWTRPFHSGAGGDFAGSDGEEAMYLNQLVCATTSLDTDELVHALKDMEHRMGRCAEDRRQGVVRIDLDLLQYDSRRHHQQDWDRPYIKALLVAVPPQFSSCGQ